MATVTSIADALVVAIDTVSGIDYISTDSFLPTVQATTAAALVVPFAQESIASFDTLNADAMYVVHRISVEVWVRYRPDSISGTMDSSRELSFNVLAAIYGSDGSGYTLARERESTAVTEDAFREIATGLVFLVSRLAIWVEDRITV